MRPENLGAPAGSAAVEATYRPARVGPARQSDLSRGGCGVDANGCERPPLDLQMSEQAAGCRHARRRRVIRRTDRFDEEYLLS